MRLTCLKLHGAQKTNKNCVSLHSCRVWHCWDFRGVAGHTLTGVPWWVGTTFSRGQAGEQGWTNCNRCSSGPVRYRERWLGMWEVIFGLGWVSEWVSCRLVDKGLLVFCSFSCFCHPLGCEFKQISAFVRMVVMLILPHLFPFCTATLGTLCLSCRFQLCCMWLRIDSWKKSISYK